jgi:hypothetical protein
VIDTNVPKVANGTSDQASPQCVLACIAALDSARAGLTCLDDAFRIIGEYTNNLNMAGQPGAGDAFMKWVFDNQANPSHCEIVRVTPTRAEAENYREFLNDPELQEFDPSDRKFVAAALASQHAPPILNAVDSDWWNAREALRRNGIRINHVCGPDQFQR